MVDTIILFMLHIAIGLTIETSKVCNKGNCKAVEETVVWFIKGVFIYNAEWVGQNFVFQSHLALSTA